MTFEELVIRTEALEKRLAALTVGDLPLAALQRKLEQSWQPDASVLLQPGSITPELMTGVADADGGGIKLADTHVRWGTTTFVFTASATSATVNIAHGLAAAPAHVFAAVRSTVNVHASSTAQSATDISLQARTLNGTSPTANFAGCWLAVAIG